MKLSSLEDVYYGHLRDIASAERQLVKALDTLAEAASDETLQQIFREHKEETQQQLAKVEELLKNAGKSSRGRKSAAMEGIIADGARIASATGDEAAKNAGLVTAGRQTEHFEMFAYTAAIAMATALEKQDDVGVLNEIFEQERSADEKLRGALESGSQGEALAFAGVEHKAASYSGGGAHGSDSAHERRRDMPRDYDDRYDGGYEGRSRGGQRSAQMQDRDEQGRFTGYEDDYGSRGGSRGGYSSGSRGSSSRGGYDRDDDDRGGRGNFGGYEGRSRGGQHSAEMQERDEQGRFMGYESGGRGGRGGYDRDDDRGYSSSRGGYSSSRGGREYDDDDRGGYSRGGGRSSGGNGGRGREDAYITDSAGRHYTEESWERAQEGRSRGGQNSGGGRGGYDDDRGGSSRGGYSSGSRGSSSRGGYDRDDDDRGGYSRGGRGGEYVDSAGRHYTRESWERAQEGRSRGGQHSHMND